MWGIAAAARGRMMVAAVFAGQPSVEPPELPSELPSDPPSDSPSESPRLSVRWEVPDGCPSKDAVEARIAALVPEGAGVPLVAEVRLERGEIGVRGELSLQTPEGSSVRTLAAEQCGTVAEATALLVAITLDPLATDRVLEAERTQAQVQASAPEPEPVASVPAVTSVEPEPEPETGPESIGSIEPTAEEEEETVRSRPPSTERTQALVRIEAGADAGVLPQPGVAIGGAVGLRRRWLRLGVHARYWLPQRVIHSQESTVSAQLRAFAAGAHGCGGPRWNAVELPICAGVDAGLVQGEGQGTLTYAGSETRPWVALRLGPAVGWSPIPRIGLWAGIDVAASVLRPRFHIASLGPIYEVGVVSGRAFVALEARFP